jgi:uncharacterized coiled-coil DUF342 family protein
MTKTETDQEKKKELVQKLTQKLLDYQTQMGELQNKIDDVKKELEELKEEKENKEKEVKENDAEIISMLETALAETVKIDDKFSNLKSSIEVPPKSK